MSSFCTAKATHIFFSKKFQNICLSLDVNFNESLTNDVVSFEQMGPDLLTILVLILNKSILLTIEVSKTANKRQTVKTLIRLHVLDLHCLLRHLSEYTEGKYGIHL